MAEQIIGAPPPTFPQTQVSITPDGKAVIGLTFTQALGEDVMSQLCKGWIESRKAIKQQLAVIEEVRRSKVHD